MFILAQCNTLLFWQADNNTARDGPSSSVTHDNDDDDVDDDDDDLDMDELNELEANLSRTTLQINEPKDKV